MRQSTPLIIAALSCHALARYLPWSDDIQPTGPALPTQTQAPHLSDINFGDDPALPRPPQTTPAPSNAILELLLRRQDSSSASNTWENSHTCGWYSGVSSEPFTCESPLTCATNTDHAIACSTAGLTEFHTACLNYDAVQSGACDPAGPKTQCCSDSASPACGTMLWTGSPSRTMFTCLATATAFVMLDKPQFVIDASSSAAAASRSSAAAASSSAAAASSSSAAAASSAASAASASSAAAASRASGLGGSSVTITTTLDGSSTTFTAVAGATGSVSGITIVSSVQYTATGSDGSSTTYTAIAENGVSGSSGGSGNDGGSGGSNTAAIAGGVVGGGIGLLLLLLLLWYLLRKKQNKFSLSLCGGKKKTNKEKHVHNENDNRAYNDEKHNTYRNSGGSSPGNDGGGGGGFSLFGGKNKSKKEKNVTNNYYYGDEVRNDNRAYDKRAFKDNRKYTNDRDDRSRSVTPNQQVQNFHFDIEGPGRNSTTKGRHSSDIPDEMMVGAAAAGSRRLSSRRDQRSRQGPSRGTNSRAQSHDSDSRSLSPGPVAAEAAVAGTTSRRDRRKMQRKQARGDYSPEPYSPQLDPELEAGMAVQRTRGGDREVEVEHDDGYGYGYERDAAQQPQHVHVHVHVHDRDRDRDVSQSRRDRQHDYEDEEDDFPEEEWQQGRGSSAATHRYHPNSGRRNAPASRSPSPPAAGPADDFIGRGL